MSANSGGSAVVDRSRRWPSLGNAMPNALLLLAALATWLASLGQVDLESMSDLGLVSVMSPASWLPFVLLSAGFFLSFGSPATSRWLPFLYLGALVLVLHATPVIEYGTLRYPWTWKHLGLVDYLQRYGEVDRNAAFLGAYHNWPGFFAAAAMIVELVGLDDLASVARWSPLVLTLLYVAILPTIYRQFTDDSRIVYCAVWVFVTGNWVGQDYFSPQGAAYLLYLAFLALCLRYLVRPVPPLPAPRLPLFGLIDAGSIERLFRGIPDGGLFKTGNHRSSSSVALATGIVLVLLVAITVSHQLTPLAMIMVLGALTALRLIGPGVLLFAVTLFCIWVLYFASPFFAESLVLEFQNLKTVSHFAEGFIDISVVSRGQAIVAGVSRLLTFAVALTALVGGIRRLAAGYRDLVAAVLVVAPLPLGIVTSYGGEAIFRIYLFALPALAFFAAAAFFPSLDTGRSSETRARAWVFGLALAVAFVFANNGKDRQYAFLPEEISAAEWLYETAPDGTLLVEGATFYPRQMRNYERFTYVSISDEPPDSVAEILANPARVLEGWVTDDQYNAAFIIITRGQKAHIEALRFIPPDALDHIEQALLASPRFVLVYANRGATIFAPNPAVRGMGEWVD